MSFDLYIRAMDAKGCFRVALLPHLEKVAAGSGPPRDVEQPWSRLTPPPPPNPATGEVADELWLPPFGTTLQLAFPAGSQVRVVDLTGSPEKPLGVRLLDPAAQPLTCFGGYNSELAGENREATILAIKALRRNHLLLHAMLWGYGYPGDLLDYCFSNADGVPPETQIELHACLSHLVFDLVPPAADYAALRNAGVAPWPTTLTLAYPADVGTSETLQPKTQSGAQAVRVDLLDPVTEGQVFAVKAAQDAAGIHFRILEVERLIPDETKRSNYQVRLCRSEGNAPTANPPIIDRSPLVNDGVILPGDSNFNRPEWHINDTLPQGTLEGVQLFYRIELINVAHEVFAHAEFETVRRRGDVPPDPAGACVRLVYELADGDGTSGAIEVEASWPDLEKQVAWHAALPSEAALAEEFEPVLYVQKRRRDECGFFGDADDFSLLEGLAQVDPNFDPRARPGGDPPKDGETLADPAVGNSERAGLSLVETTAGDFHWEMTRILDANGVPAAGATPMLLGRLPLSILAPAGAGFRFFLSLRRRGWENPLQSPLFACTHEVRLVTGEAAPKIGSAAGVIDIPIFQLEKFDPPAQVDESEPRVLRFLIPPGAPGTDPAASRGCFESQLLYLPPDPVPADFPLPPPEQARRVRAGDLVPPPADDFARADSYAVRINFIFPTPASLERYVVTEPAQAPISAIGGVRVLYRDQSAEGENLPFRVADEIQVSPAYVSLRRPVRFDEKAPVEAAPSAREGDPNLPSKPLPGTGSGTEIIHAWLPKLRQTLDDAAAALCSRKNFSVRHGTAAGSGSSYAASGPAAGGGSVKFPDRAENAEWTTLEGLVAAGTATDAQRVRKTELDTSADPGVWNTWLPQVRTWLPFAESELPKDPTSWPVMSRLIALMYELGLCVDLVAGLDAGPDAWTLLKEEVGNAVADPGSDADGQSLPTPDFDRIKFVALETFDGQTMATIRMFVVPWAPQAFQVDDTGNPPPPPPLDFLQAVFNPFNKSNYLLYGAAALSPRFLRYCELAQRPLTLTMDRFRGVRYDWSGLRDRWGHRLEFALQVLDRYHRIRERIREERVALAIRMAAATGDPAEIRDAELRRRNLRRQRIESRELEMVLSPALVERVTHRCDVPRIEPLPPVPALLRAANCPPTLLAVEIMETVESRQSAFNARARTRYGEPHLNLWWDDTFPAGNLYGGAGFSNPAVAPWTVAPDFAKEWTAMLGTAGLAGFPHPDRLQARRPAWSGPLAAGPLVWGDPEILPPPRLDARDGFHLAVKRNEPYFLAYTVAAVSAADGREGPLPAKPVKLTREPAGLALPVLPVWSFAGAPANRLKITLLPALLGSHLNALELTHLMGDPQLELKDVLGADGHGYCGRLRDTPPGDSDVPLLLLPDLWLEYNFYLNLGTKAKPVRVPLLVWSVIHEGDAITPLDHGATTPLNFTLKPGPDVKAEPPVWTGGAFVELAGTVEPTLGDIIAQAGPNRIELFLRRGALFTEFLPLPQAEAAP